MAFSEAMQIADRNGLTFLTGWLLERRAEHYYEKNAFVLSKNFDDLEKAVSVSANMPRTLIRILFRDASNALTMKLPSRALTVVNVAKLQLEKYPDAGLSAKAKQLESLAQQTRLRMGDEFYRPVAH